MKLRLSLAAAALALAPLVAQANLIVNGGFEEPALSSGSWGVYSSILGWTATFGSGIEIQNNAAGAPYQGAQHVELDSHYGTQTNSGMAQTVATTAGLQYLLSFAYSPRPNVGSTSNGIELWIDSVLLDTFTAAGGQATSWSIRNFRSAATSTTCGSSQPSRPPTAFRSRAASPFWAWDSPRWRHGAGERSSRPRP